MGLEFPTTRLSVIAGLRDPDRARATRSFARVAEAYGAPLYKHVRLKWRRSPEDAEDLIQAFLTVSFEKEYLAAWDPARATFRSFLRTCLDRFVAKDLEASRAAKRGGGQSLLSLDLGLAEKDLASAAVPDVETAFEQAWKQQVFQLALASLREELLASGRPERWRAFEAYDLADPGERPSYQLVAERLSLPVTTVTNHLAFARRELRRHVIETLRELTAGEDELRSEVRALLGDTL